MAEGIKSIAEFEDKDEQGWSTIAGFKIQTTEQEITLQIDNDASCCEQWGYFLTEDDTAKFVGATLIGLNVTDTAGRSSAPAAVRANPRTYLPLWGRFER